MSRHLKNLTYKPGVEDRTVGERQKISTCKPDMEDRTVGRQQKNRHINEAVRMDSLI